MSVYFSLIVVISSKRIEYSKLMPSCTQLFFLVNCKIFVSKETTDVCTYHWNSKHIHIIHAWNRVSHVLPWLPIVSSPMSSILTWARESRSWDHEWPIDSHILNLISSFALHYSIKWMEIILNTVLILFNASVLRIKRYSLILKRLWVWSFRIEYWTPVFTFSQSSRFWSINWTFSLIIIA